MFSLLPQGTIFSRDIFEECKRTGDGVLFEYISMSIVNGSEWGG